jgi:metal-sulfur cluster biosynthetic enzyme
MPDQQTIYDALKAVSDPEVGINIVDMGLIYGLEIADSKVDVYMTLTSPACPAGPQILKEVDHVVRDLDGVEEVDINVVWSPPWNPDMLSDEAKDELGIF